MNLPGTLGGSNWAWRFAWHDLAADVGATLARIAQDSGRALRP
jgi:4-alpha-glucanotransferase